MYVNYYLTIIKLHYKSNQLDHIFLSYIAVKNFLQRQYCVFSISLGYGNTSSYKIGIVPA
jgi:hypothetical protein